MNEVGCRLFYEVVRWSLRSEDSLESSRSLQNFLNVLGHEEFSEQWRQIRSVGGAHRDVLIRAFSSGQIESKLLLVDLLKGVLPSQPYNICIIGGWVGVLPRLIHWLAPELVRRMVLIDMDVDALDIAYKMQFDLIQEKKLELQCADVTTMDFNQDYNLIINCACEHFSNNSWYDRVPSGRLVALQSNNHWDDPEHVSCVNSITEFRDAYPIELSLYKGQTKLEKFIRFTMIGRK